MHTEYLKDDANAICKHANELIRSGIYAFKIYNKDKEDELLLCVNAFSGEEGISFGKYTKINTEKEELTSIWEKFSLSDESLGRWTEFDNLEFPDRVKLMCEQLTEEEYNESYLRLCI